MAGTKEKAPATRGPKVSESQIEIPDYVPGSDWDEEVRTADQVNGHDLAKDELLDALVGVPFLITRLTFRPGFPLRGDTAVGPKGKVMAYVSCEGVIAPEHVLKRRRVNMENLPFEPGSQVVFNDGSTGIYRQIVAYLEARGLVELPDGLAEGGEYGTCKYDLPPSDWSEVRTGEIRFDETGFAEYEANIRLTCPRGLRVSEYENEYNPAGSKTRYLG